MSGLVSVWHSWGSVGGARTREDPGGRPRGGLLALESLTGSGTPAVGELARDGRTPDPFRSSGPVSDGTAFTRSGIRPRPPRGRRAGRARAGAPAARGPRRRRTAATRRAT